MRRRFNTTGSCNPKQHYMVNMDSRLAEIREMVAYGDYFTINRARQYGKTTTLSLLKKSLSDQYCVFSVSLEGVEEEAYASTSSFYQLLAGLLYDVIAYGEVQDVPQHITDGLLEMSEVRDGSLTGRSMSNFITRMCQEIEKPVVLMINEVDQASNQKTFLSFLGMLRNKYLSRTERETFQSVILAGVYDVKNMKLKIRSEQEHQYNSPWNIAADFQVNMGLPKPGILEMLAEYEQDYHTGMQLEEMTNLL